MIWNDTEFSELQPSGNLPGFVIGVSTMPHKGMEPGGVEQVETDELVVMVSSGDCGGGDGGGDGEWW